jgi:hypothetical protein
MMNTDRYCFCDLAPLYPLGALTEAEQVWVEQQAASDPDLAAELLSYQGAIANLPLSLPPLPMAGDLKNRLFQNLDLEPPVPSPPELPLDTASHFAIRAQDLRWRPYQTPGVSIAIVHTDRVRREIVGFIQADAGVRYPLHRHAATEELFMLEGDLVIGNEVFGPGDYILSQAGSSHAPYTNGGCRFFFHTSMDDEYPSWEQPAVINLV